MADTTEQPITEAELRAAVDSFKFFSIRMKAIFALGEKAEQLLSLLGAERERRTLLAELDQQAAAAREVIAAGSAAQNRLTRIEGEIARHLTEAKAEAERTLNEARSEASRIKEQAQATADGHIEEARAASAAEAARLAEKHAGSTRERQAELDRL